MELSGHQVLVTGGTSGIGLGIAKLFYAAGSEVAICGRRGELLESISATHPGMKTFVCDVSKPEERMRLREWAEKSLPGLNIFVNNAGIQNRVKVDQDDFWKNAETELQINLAAPLHLSALFIPLLKKNSVSYLMNVTSGLSFSPLAMVPVYCATKAALHSYTLSTRHQLLQTPIKVVEIIPPAVDTDLGGVGLHTFGVPLNEFIEAVKTGLLRDDLEIAFGHAEKASKASRAELDQIFRFMNLAQR